MGTVKKGVWLHHFPQTEAEVRSLVKRLSDHGFDLVIPCVKNPDGYLDYHSVVGNVRPAFTTFDPLRTMTEETSRCGLEVHPWICVFPEGEGSRLLAEHPEYAALTRPGPKAIRGEYGIRWACSSREEVHRYQLDLYRELLSGYEVGGVHLDYVRYCSRFAGVESCFCDYCRERFSSETGYQREIADLQRDHPCWWRWVGWRAQRIASFVAALRELAGSFGKEVSAAVFPDYPNCIEEVGQDWAQWARGGLVDRLFPMNYSQSPEVVAAWSTAHRQHAGQVRLWEGIRTFKDSQPENLRAILEALREQEVEGIVLFEYFLFSDDFLAIVDSVLR